MQAAQTKVEEASAGSLTMAERCLAVAALLKREAGVTEHLLRSELSGRAWYKQRRISAPEGRTREQLYILAHECGHIAIPPAGKPVHVREMEAEQWAHEALRGHGVAVPKAMTERARRYVASKISRALKRGAKDIDPRAVQFAEGARSEKRPEAVDRWCREHGKTEAALRRLLRSWTDRFVRLDDGDSGLPRWIAICMEGSISEAVSVLRWARLYPGKDTPPTQCFPEV